MRETHGGRDAVLARDILRMADGMDAPTQVIADGLIDVLDRRRPGLPAPKRPGGSGVAS